MEAIRKNHSKGAGLSPNQYPKEKKVVFYSSPFFTRFPVLPEPQGS